MQESQSIVQAARQVVRLRPDQFGFDAGQVN